MKNKFEILNNNKIKYELPDFEKLKPQKLKKAVSNFSKICNKILEKDLKGEKND